MHYIVEVLIPQLGWLSESLNKYNYIIYHSDIPRADSKTL